MRGGRGCGKLSTGVGNLAGLPLNCGFVREFPASCGFIWPVLCVWVEFSASNNIKTVFSPLVAVDQAVLVELVVAVEERDERAWHLAPRVNHHGA